MTDSAKEIILAILGSGALYTFIQFFINRWDQKRGIEKKIDNLTEDLNEYKATQARTHILRFADELRNHMVHSKDYFDQTSKDIDDYEAYCDSHPEFKNGLTKMAVKYIKDEYARLYFPNGEENSK